MHDHMLTVQLVPVSMLAASGCPQSASGAQESTLKCCEGLDTASYTCLRSFELDRAWQG